MKTFTLHRFMALPKEIHVMMAGTMLTRGAYFMVWPFIAILLYRQFHLSATLIGALLTVSTVFGAISGVYTGWLSDRYGRRRVIVCGAVLSAFSFILLSQAQSAMMYAVGIAGVSVGCMLLESSCKALIGDRIEDKASKELAFYCRYYAINIGAAIGPLLGVTLGVAAKSATFGITALIYLFYGLLLWLLLPDTLPSSRSTALPKTKTPFFEACRKMARHHLFIVLLLCNLLVALVYANFDSSMVQYLTREGIPDVLKTVASLIAINAMTILIAQFPVLRYLQPFLPRTRIIMGMVLLLVAQLLYVVVPASSLFWLSIATVLLSLGELIVFPTFSVEIDSMTPNDLRGSYFGAGNLSMLGNAIAPVYGGLMLDNYGHRALFLGLAFLCVVVMVLQHRTREHHQQNQDMIG